MRVDKEKAFVLHRRPYRNTSFIVELLTEHYGRVSVVARSARGVKSRYRGQLESFIPLLVSWTERHELKNLGNIELLYMSALLQGEALMCGFYLNELLMRLLHPHDPHPRVFSDYQQALDGLLERKPIEPLLRRFEKYLLDELGYGLTLHREFKNNSPINPEAFYRYIPDRGFLEDSSGDHSQLFSGQSLLALHDDELNSEVVLKDAKRLMRWVLSFYLGSKPLRSRELLS